MLVLKVLKDYVFQATGPFHIGYQIFMGTELFIISPYDPYNDHGISSELSLLHF